MARKRPVTAIVLFFISAAAAAAPIVFEDVTERKGLSTHLEGWQLAHGAAWGDVTGNGLPDLYIGAFADRPVYESPDAPMPNMLFLNEPGGFTLSEDGAVRYDTRGLPRDQRARVSMALFVDLNNNGKLDLLVGTHSGPRKRLLENRWPDNFRDVTPAANGWPADFHMRNATALDVDRDGLLDLVFIDGRYGGGRQRVTLLRNRGKFEFEDVGGDYGFPFGGTPGLGSAIGDINNNGRLDLFVPHANRLFVSRDDGTYAEHDREVFQIQGLRGQEWPCGAAFADLTGNGLLDLVITVHGVARHAAFPGHVFVFVNRGIGTNGMPKFENVTREAGLSGFRLPSEGRDLRAVEALNVSGDTPVRLPLQAAQVALPDMNNNGRRDILLGMIHEDEEGRLRPVVLRNKGLIEGIPQFEYPPLESILCYYATAPVADYDRDGRVDIFMASWFHQVGSYLFRNVTEGGNYLVVRVEGRDEGLNSMGVGATVRLYRAGHVGEAEHLLGRGDITLANGYSVGDEALVHFGLGETDVCDLVVDWQGHRVVISGVEANQYLSVPVGEGE